MKSLISKEYTIHRLVKSLLLKISILMGYIFMIIRVYKRGWFSKLGEIMVMSYLLTLELLNKQTKAL